MPIVAYAFHGQISIERLKRYYRSPEAGTNSETRTGFCPKCLLNFELLLVNEADPKNQNYVDKLTRLIEEDCINGMHRDEYVLSVGQVVEL